MTSAVSDALAIARYHIVLVAMTASVVFGWILTGRYELALTLLVAVDWFVINLTNRITDIDEDLANGIPGTERVARSKRLLVALAIALVVGSFAVTWFVWPALVPWRALVQAIGLAYNYRLVPTPRGFKRFKEIYFLKNFMSAVLFVLTCVEYPLAANGVRFGATAAALVLFFVPFELTYEVLYDVRDVEGDRAEGIPTFPVVHGLPATRKILAALLFLSGASLAGALLLRVVHVREGLMIFALAIQYAFYRSRWSRGITTRDCIVVTHQGTALLLLFLIGTALWQRAGLPSP